MTELERKLSVLRACLDEGALGAIRFRGVDWFAWATCGGSNVVLLTTDVGVAEVLVTREVKEAAGRHLSFQPIGEVKLKGFDVATELFLARRA